jgi:ribonuclease VapC
MLSRGLLGAAVVSAVNWSEVLQRYSALGLDTAGRRDSVEALGIAIEDFSGDDAETAASMWASTRSAGLSLADRALPVSSATTSCPRAYG